MTFPVVISIKSRVKKLHSIRFPLTDRYITKGKLPCQPTHNESIPSNWYSSRAVLMFYIPIPHRHHHYDFLSSRLRLEYLLSPHLESVMLENTVCYLYTLIRASQKIGFPNTFQIKVAVIPNPICSPSFRLIINRYLPYTPRNPRDPDQVEKSDRFSRKYFADKPFITTSLEAICIHWI